MSEHILELKIAPTPVDIAAATRVVTDAELAGKVFVNGLR